MPGPEPGEDQIADLDQHDPADASEPKTEGQVQAALASPDIVTTGATTMSPLTSLAGSGLLMNGGIDLASWGQASFWLGSSAMTVTAELTVNPAPNASFQYTLIGSGKSYATKNLRIQRVFGSDTLQALATTGLVNCGALPSNQATPVTVSLDRNTATFDVLIGGAQSACTNLPTRIVGPIKSFHITDSGYQDQGGRIAFTDLTLF